jgi:predicted ferric reductase
MFVTANVAWYAARAGGLVAFVLLTVAVAIGLLLSGRARLAAWPRFAIEEVHAFAGMLAGIFIVVHGAGLLLDDYFEFGLTDLLVPGSAPTRPLAAGLGVVAAELLAAIAITNKLRRRLPHRIWRRVHYLNFAVWLLALVHGIAVGTDSDTVWAISLYLSSVALVGGLTTWRFLEVRSRFLASS